MKKEDVMKNRKSITLTAVAALILVISMMCLSACGGNSGDADTDGGSGTVDAIGTVDGAESKNEHDGTSDVGNTDTETNKETETDTDTDTETESDSDSTTTDTSTTDTETAPPEEDVGNAGEPEFINPLTGLASDVDLSKKRPAAIMINNLKKATPQHGVTDADIIYEILAEGGITRLMLVVTEYEKLGIVGSVRSTRHYYLDYAYGLDAIIAHAGGSPMAYDMIDTLGLPSLDGVRMNLGKMYYRDEWRKENMGYEHSLMTTGERIVSGIKKKDYSTTHKSSFKNTMEFVDYGTRADLDGKAATHVKLKYHSSQVVDLVYDAATDKYLRYQYSGVAHIDKNNGQQLAFDNVVIVLTDIWQIKGDVKNRRDVTTTGTGKGYFVAGGEYIEITWSKKSDDAPLIITDKNGNPIEYNRGKTFISIFDKDSTCKIDTSSFTPKG